MLVFSSQLNLLRQRPEKNGKHAYDVRNGAKISLPIKYSTIKGIVPTPEDVRKVIDEEGYRTIEQFDNMSPHEDAFTHQMLRFSIVKEAAGRKYVLGRYPEACEECMKAARMMLGNKELMLPSFNDEHSDEYNMVCKGLGTKETVYLTCLISCYNNVAQCWIKLGNRIKVSYFQN